MAIRTQQTSVKVIEVDGRQAVEVTTDTQTKVVLNKAGLQATIARLGKATETLAAQKAASAQRFDEALANVARQKADLEAITLAD